MTATTGSAECNAPGTTLMLAFDLRTTTWTLGFTNAPAQRPRTRTISAVELVTLVKEIQRGEGVPRRARGRTSGARRVAYRCSIGTYARWAAPV